MRRILLWMVLIAEIGLVGWLIARHSDPALVGYDDFISSWAAGRLNAFGQNPYDPALVLALQRTVGWTEVIPYRIWYPPWAMPLLEPFGMLPHHTGRMVWWFVHILALGVSADLLWRYFGGPRHLRAASWIVMITFWPAVADLVTGQVSAFMLLGMAGFLSLERSGRPMAAGAVLPLATIKPTVLHLVWIALLLWVLRERQWRVAVGALASGIGLLLVALASNPGVVGHFLDMALNDAPRQHSSTLGALLRKGWIALAGRDFMWLQLIPSVVGMAWVVARWRTCRTAWDWREQMPVLIVASVVSTSYGWIYDDVVLLVPMIQVAVALIAQREHSGARAVLVAYVAFDGAVLAMNVAEVDPFLYVWVPLGFLAWYGFATLRGVMDRPTAQTVYATP